MWTLPRRIIWPKDTNARPKKQRNQRSSRPPPLDRVVAASRRLSNEPVATYRERALKLFPWICGRCGREFSGTRLRELTVHHKDHDHDNNPPDGSTWGHRCTKYDE